MFFLLKLPSPKLFIPFLTDAIKQSMLFILNFIHVSSGFFRHILFY